jgi:hypothetical protein
VTAILARLDRADRDRILERMRELADLRRLAETPPEPPDQIASNDTKGEPAP